MNNQFNKLDDILYHDLRPWIDSDKSMGRFTPLIPKIPIVNPNFNSLWEVDFHRPLNPKAEYYYKLIINETNQYCNNVIDLINEDDNIMRQQHWYKDTIINKLQPRLIDVINVIKEHQYFVEYINPRNANFDVNTEHKTESFILQLLKVAYVKIYLELQELFHHLSDEHKLSEFDIYDRFLNQPLPENSFLKRNQITVGDKIEPVVVSENQQNVGEISYQSFTYKKLDTGSDKLTDLYKNLKENEFITKDNPLANFKTVFSGSEVHSPVVWSGSTKEFYYFVYLIHNEYELIEPLKRRLWKVARKCFIRFDGSQFDIKKLKEATNPEERAELLEKAVELIK